MNDLSKARATLVEVGEDAEAQRIDNFLLRRLKGVPKSHIYRVLRSGEVRVNSARVRADYRLREGDRVRVPPIRTADPEVPPTFRPPPLDLPVAHEDDALLVIDKPGGIAVHGGSGVRLGAIESLRAERPQSNFLELAHRLDRDTSGLLLLAKTRRALVDLHRQFRDGSIEKLYLAVVRGRWRGDWREIRVPLRRAETAAGERRMRASPEGIAAVTRARAVAVGELVSLLEVQLLTGRMHQIRVHLAHAGHPIVGDDKYGDFAFNRVMLQHGVRRMLLHAHRMALRHPLTGRTMRWVSPLPDAFARIPGLDVPQVYLG